MIPSVPKGQMNLEFLKATKLTYAEAYERMITNPLSDFLNSLPNQSKRPEWLLAAVEAWEDRMAYQSLQPFVRDEESSTDEELNDA